MFRDFFALRSSLGRYRLGAPSADFFATVCAMLGTDSEQQRDTPGAPAVARGKDRQASAGTVDVNRTHPGNDGSEVARLPNPMSHAFRRFFAGSGTGRRRVFSGKAFSRFSIWSK
jgi:hypothetical protein